MNVRSALTATPRRQFTTFTIFTAVAIASWALIARHLVLVTPRITATLALCDIVGGMTAFYYFLVVRRRSAPLLTIAPLFVALVFIASALVLPASLRSFVPAPIHLIAPLELGVFAFVIIAARRTLRTAAKSTDWLDGARAALTQLTGNATIADIVASEVGVLYFAIFSWRVQPEESERSFSMHERSGWTVMSWGFVAAVVAESVAVHLWLGTRHPVASVVLALLDAYSILWLIADARALTLRRTSFDADALTIRYGARWQARVPVAQIASIAAHRGEAPRSREVAKLAMIEDPNFVVTLREPLTLHGMCGLRRKATQLYLLVDDAARFESVARDAALFHEEKEPIRLPESEMRTASEKTVPVSREEWLRRRPAYISEEDWMKFVPRNSNSKGSA